MNFSIFKDPKFQGTVGIVGGTVRDGGRGTTGGKRQAMARGDDGAGGSGAGRGTAKDELPKCGGGQGKKPLINRFQGNHRTEMLWSKGPGFHFLVICEPGARLITSRLNWESGV